MNSFLDHIPSHEREKIRKRLRSPEEYERLRERVKGPEDLEREMEKNAEFAELSLSLESHEKFQEQARKTVQEMCSKEGIDALIDRPSEKVKDALGQGHFDVMVDHTHHEPRLAIRVKEKASPTTSDAPIGNVQEVFPLKPALQQQVMIGLKMAC